MSQLSMIRRRVALTKTKDQAKVVHDCNWQADIFPRTFDMCDRAVQIRLGLVVGDIKCQIEIEKYGS